MSAIEAAERFLRAELRKGPREVRELQKHARERGLAWRTVKSTKKTLGVLSKREGFGPGSLVSWKLPERETSRDGQQDNDEERNEMTSTEAPTTRLEQLEAAVEEARAAERAAGEAQRGHWPALEAARQALQALRAERVSALDVGATGSAVQLTRG